jgi:hypothetical protein
MQQSVLIFTGVYILVMLLNFGFRSKAALPKDFGGASNYSVFDFEVALNWLEVNISYDV